MAMYRCGSNSGVTPTSITPSNATPAAMSSGEIYQATAAGYAIESYDSKTPDDTTPPTVASGDIVKMGGAGYLYATQQGGGGGVELVEAPASAALNTPKTYTNLEIGKTYTYFVCQAGSRDCAVGSVTNGTFVEKEKSTSSSMSYSVTWITPTSTSITVTMNSASSGVVFKVLFG